MRNFVWGTMFVTVAALAAQPVEAAQPGDLIDEGTVDLLRAAREEFRGTAGEAAVTEDQVGDADSFGRDKIYLGVSQTTPVVVQADCTGSPPEEVCIEHLPAPATTSVDEFDLGMIELPDRASNSLLCFTFTQFSTWLWGNTTGSTQTGSMGLLLTVQIENDVLNGLTNSDGFPFNGSLFLDNTGAPFPEGILVSTRQNTLPDGAFEIQRERTTRSCTGGLVSARSLRAEGLTDAQIKDFFKEPMTVRFGVRGTVRMTEVAIFFGGIRIYGD